jgi:hypothetical protein
MYKVISENFLEVVGDCFLLLRNCFRSLHGTVNSCFFAAVQMLSQVSLRMRRPELQRRQDPHAGMARRARIQGYQSSAADRSPGSLGFFGDSFQFRGVIEILNFETPNFFPWPLRRVFCSTTAPAFSLTSLSFASFRSASLITAVCRWLNDATFWRC